MLFSHMLQYDIGFKKRIVILYKLMIWRYMADRKLIDVKPTRKEILYGFFCTGISLVILIILGIMIVVFANKYMQNMKGNQNYLENFIITTEDTTSDILSSVTTNINGNENNEDVLIKTKLMTSETISTSGMVRKALTATTKTTNSGEKITKFNDNQEKWIPSDSIIATTLIDYDHSKMKIKEISEMEAKKFYEMMNESIEKNVS